jgi:hypothetical protein
MERFIVLIFFGTIFFSCQNASSQKDGLTTAESISNMPSLEGTKWQFKIADDCINYYLFKSDSNSIYYSCESDDKYYGKYYIKDDTLYIQNFVTDTDSLLSSMESEHRSQRAKYKLILEDNKLKHVERWSYSVTKDLWTKDNFDFGDDFLFEKVK